MVLLELFAPNNRAPFNHRPLERVFVSSKPFAAHAVWAPGTVSVSFEPQWITNAFLSNVRHAFKAGEGRVDVYAQYYSEEENVLCKSIPFNIA